MCGAKLPELEKRTIVENSEEDEKNVCKSCGEKLEEDAMFCQSCCTKVE